MDEYDMGHTRKIVETVNVYSRDDISAYKEEEQRIIRNLRSASYHEYWRKSVIRWYR